MNKLIKNKEVVLSKWLSKIDSDIDEIEFQTSFSKILDVIEDNNSKKDLINELVDNLHKYEITPKEVANIVLKLIDVLDEENFNCDEKNNYIKKIYELAFNVFEEFEVIQKDVVNKQLDIIKNMEVPILRLDDDTILIPLIGFLDSQKAFDLIRKILTTIKEKNTLKVIVDIEGIPVIDTEIANQFLRLHRAIKIIGAKLIISGITPAVAETLVHLEIDLPIKTRANLKLAIETFRNNEI